MSQDSMQAYLRDVRRHHLIDRDREHKLAVRYRDTGDRRLARTLVTAHLRLVIKIANEYRWSGLAFEDRVQAGNMGLLRAVEKYDPDRGVRLSSYASWWIRASILNAAIANLRLVRVGTTARQRKIIGNLRAAREELARQGANADPELEALVRHVTTPEVALDEPAAGDDQSRLLRLPASNDERPDALVEQREYLVAVRETMREFAAGLHGREAVLFRERWGRDEPATLQAIGDRFGISRERARQIEERMLSRLRPMLVERLNGSTIALARAA